MRTARTFTLSLLIAVAGALGALGATTVALAPATADHVTVAADGTPPDDTHW